MHVKLLKTHLPQLLPWLEQRLPHSFKIHGELKSHLRGQFPDLEFFVDRWPRPQAVLAAVDPAGQQLLCRDFYVNLVHGLYAVNDEAMRSLLTDPNVVDWNTRSVFSFTDSFEPLLQSVADQMGRRTSSEHNFLLKATPQHLKPIPVPKELKIQPISAVELGVINSTWKYSSEGSDSYIQYLVQHFPSVYLVTENGEHVGHMISYTYDTMGMLYVSPEFRRRGYAKVIISQLAQMFFDCGQDAYVIVTEGHSISLSLHESLGFRVVPEMKVIWMRCTPKQSCNSCKQPSAVCCV